MDSKDPKNADFEDRQATRERLKREKPRVYEKFLELDRRARKGQKPPPVIEVAYRYDCNLACKHCFAARFERKSRSLTVADMKDLSGQAGALGVHQFILQGGEPLFWPDFDEVVRAVNPQEFYLGLVTNAVLLDRARIGHLREIGIDKIVMSLDSFDKVQYEDNRNRPGLFDHTVEMLLEARKAGLRVVINTLVTRQNVRSERLLELVEFAKKNGFILYVNFASPIGNWEGRYDLLLTPEDADYIYALNREHEIIKRDIFPYGGQKIGCPALRSIVYITQYGDVLPCPFVHIAVGNIFEEPLAGIIEKGLRIKWFKDRPPVCLACEDEEFIREKIARIYGKASPVRVDELLTDEDLI